MRVDGMWRLEELRKTFMSTNDQGSSFYPVTAVIEGCERVKMCKCSF